MDRVLLLLSTLCFGLAFAGSAAALRRAAVGGRGAASRAMTDGRGRWHAVALGVGFLLQTAFLVVRGQAAGRCPLTGPGETLAFVAWATVLFHLLIGNAYRLSPLGAFTAPAAFALQVGALLALGAPGTRRPAAAADPWLEFHAAFSVLAYGAFALAAVAGGLYLWQERQLKSRRPHPLFFFFPPMGDLGRVNGRLLGVGFALLTAGLAAGWVALGTPRSNVHFLCAVATWALYGGLVLARWRHFLPPRRLATLSLAALGVAFVTLGGITFVEGSRRKAEDGNPVAPPPLISPAATSSRQLPPSVGPWPDRAPIPAGQPLT